MRDMIKVAEVKTLGGTMQKRCVFSGDGISPCLLSSCYKDPIKVLVRVGGDE